MTAKTLRNKGQVDSTGGESREQRAINRRNKIESSLLPRGGDGLKHSSDRKERLSLVELEMRKFHACRVAVANLEEQICAIEQQRFGEHLYDGELFAFEERSFGTVVKLGEKTYRTSANVDRDLSSSVVSLALFDGDTMLFACSGIPLPYGTARLQLTRFVTSAHLVREFKNYRNKVDKLRVSVRLPNNKTTDGLLGLYDDDIAIVTCLGLLDVFPINLNDTATPVSPSDSLLAAGRAYMSGSLMAMHGSQSGVCDNTWVPDGPYDMYNKAVLGGPLLRKDAIFLGMSYEFFCRADGTVRYSFLPLELLRERLDRFGILNPKQIDLRNYMLPTGVSSVVPSGFMKTINRLKSYGYPMPPPLVLEFNGRLLNRFEERFGDLLAWKGYPYGEPTSFSSECVWELLSKTVVRHISRCVVSLASFKGDVRSFACTGFLIKWHGSKAMRTVILTSASLVRSYQDRDDTGNKNIDGIDKTLKAGIGGPLINFNGRFVGMNFFDGSGVTPFLPKCKIAQVLRGVIDFPLPSESEDDHPEPRDLSGRAKEDTTKEDGWPVPKTYWYHGALDVDRYDVPNLIGRCLQ